MFRAASVFKDDNFEWQLKFELNSVFRFKVVVVVSKFLIQFMRLASKEFWDILSELADQFGMLFLTQENLYKNEKTWKEGSYYLTIPTYFLEMFSSFTA